MNDLISAGKILYWGTGVWTAVQLEAVHRVADGLHLVGPTVEQPRYHMLDRHIRARGASSVPTQWYGGDTAVRWPRVS